MVVGTARVDTADEAAESNGQAVTLPRSSKRPRFQTLSLGDSDDDDNTVGKWEGTGGLLQHLNSGDELKTDNPKWRVWTPQSAGTQYAEPVQPADADKGAPQSAAVDSKDVSKKFAEAMLFPCTIPDFFPRAGTMLWPRAHAIANAAKT